MSETEVLCIWTCQSHFDIGPLWVTPGLNQRSSSGKITFPQPSACNRSVAVSPWQWVLSNVSHPQKSLNMAILTIFIYSQLSCFSANSNKMNIKKSQKLCRLDFLYSYEPEPPKRLNKNPLPRWQHFVSIFTKWEIRFALWVSSTVTTRSH